ncbi:MAG: DUF6276 family protein [Halobacteriaceae archaeon]
MPDCPRCGTAALAFPIPADLLEYFPDDRPGAALCPACLDVSPVDDPPEAYPDFQDAVSDALPRDPADAVLVACVLALADTLALYRSELSALLERAEAGGIDVFLALDRLADDPSVDPHLDLRRRRRQLEQLV